MDVELIRERAIVVRVRGEVDLSNVADLRSVLEKALEESPEGFVVDLSFTEYIDSAGIAVIIYAYQQLAERAGRLVLVTRNRNVWRILSLIHVEMMPGMYLRENVDEAEELLGSES
jgi:anti-anti-sigma factor